MMSIQRISGVGAPELDRPEPLRGAQRERAVAERERGERVEEFRAADESERVLSHENKAALWRRHKQARMNRRTGNPHGPEAQKEETRATEGSFDLSLFGGGEGAAQEGEGEGEGDGEHGSGGGESERAAAAADFETLAAQLARTGEESPPGR